MFSKGLSTTEIIEIFDMGKQDACIVRWRYSMFIPEGAIMKKLTMERGNSDHDKFTAAWLKEAKKRGLI